LSPAASSLSLAPGFKEVGDDAFLAVLDDPQTRPPDHEDPDQQLERLYLPAHFLIDL
jgi:hypothetical protein